jgi:hypothetical protein
MADSSAEPLVEPTLTEGSAVEAPVPLGGEAPAAEGGGGIVDGADATPAKLPPWFVKRIDSLTARLREEERRHADTRQTLTLTKAAHDALTEELAKLRTPETQSADGRKSPAMTEDEVNALAEQRAQLLLAQREAQSRENESAERGKAAYPDFVEKLGALKNLGGVPPNVLQTALETGAAEHILYALANDLNKASEIFEMPTGKMALELAKLAQKPGPKPVDASKAPTPMVPVNGRTPPASKDLSDKSLSQQDWFALREAQIAERKAAGRR